MKPPYHLRLHLRLCLRLRLHLREIQNSILKSLKPTGNLIHYSKTITANLLLAFGQVLLPTVLKVQESKIMRLYLSFPSFPSQLITPSNYDRRLRLVNFPPCRHCLVDFITVNLKVAIKCPQSN